MSCKKSMLTSFYKMVTESNNKLLFNKQVTSHIDDRRLEKSFIHLLFLVAATCYRNLKLWAVLHSLANEDLCSTLTSGPIFNCLAFLAFCSDSLRKYSSYYCLPFLPNVAKLPSNKSHSEIYGRFWQQINQKKATH
jgi:hypothetical protein